MVGNIKPEIISNKVVLPDPLFPTMPMIVFFFISKFIFLKIGFLSSYSKETLFREINLSKFIFSS